MVAAVAFAGSVVATAIASETGGPHRAGNHAAHGGARAVTRSTAAAAGSATQTVPVASGWTLLATPHGSIPRYAAPGVAPDGEVPAQWLSATSTLPVVAQVPGWLEVRLPQAPNETTAWVRRPDVDLTTTPYRIVVHLASTELELLDAGQTVFTAPVGIGTTQYPTVTGHFFVALLAEPPSPGYGPFVMVTSAHSATITDWEDSGDALVAIHGPLDADAAIGTSGARVSHGCIRMHDTDLAHLRNVPAGTPVDIEV